MPGLKNKKQSTAKYFASGLEVAAAKVSSLLNIFILTVKLSSELVID